MSSHSPPTADDEALDPAALHALQRRKLARLFESIQGNPFYFRKLADVHFDVTRDPMATLPFTERAELERDQIDAPPFGTNRAFPLERCSRFHQTSGTGGRAMRWIDTAESWGWVKDCWKYILRAAAVGPGDRLLFPFSFGPFLGFWSAFESAADIGCLCLPAGGLSTSARLSMMIDNGVNVVLCTPTYALRLAESAADEGIDLAGSSVTKLVVAGEPGGSMPAIRSRIETAWGARVFDHHGMTETGPVSFECAQAPGGLHVIESQYIVEVIDPATGTEVPDGQQGELVLTNLGRCASPLIRYRTGDIVSLSRKPCACGRTFARLVGGILGRRDDMFIVRGNNVFPSAVEAVLRQFPEIAEFRVFVDSAGVMSDVRIEIEPAGGANVGNGFAQRVTSALQTALSFRAEVTSVTPGTLPRFEMKARRFVRASPRG